MRLTKAIRLSIAQAVIDHQVEAATNEVRKLTSTIDTELYAMVCAEHKLSPDDVERMRSLPQGWVPMLDSVYIGGLVYEGAAVDGLRRIVLSGLERHKYPVPHYLSTSVRVNTLPSPEIREIASDILERNIAIRKLTWDENKIRLVGMLSGFKTTDDLVMAIPELAPFVPQEKANPVASDRQLVNAAAVRAAIVSTYKL